MNSSVSATQLAMQLGHPRLSGDKLEAFITKHKLKIVAAVPYARGVIRLVDPQQAEALVAAHKAKTAPKPKKREPAASDSGVADRLADLEAAVSKTSERILAETRGATPRRSVS